LTIRVPPAQERKYAKGLCYDLYLSGVDLCHSGWPMLFSLRSQPAKQLDCAVVFKHCAGIVFVFSTQHL
ncbi:MAG: hypothetical protein AAGB04_26445, partial [Pseudomonadota bacterium]